MNELKKFYDEKIPVHIRKYLKINLSWDDVNDITKFHENNSHEIRNIDIDSKSLHFGFYSKKIESFAKKINLIGLEKDKIYSSHIYIDYAQSRSPLDWHSDNCEVIYLQTLGSVKWEIKNYGEYILSEGDIIYCPKKIMHKVSSISPRVGISFGIK